MDGGHVAHALASSLDGYVNKDAKFLDLFLLQETITRKRGSHETLRKCKHKATQQAFAVKVVNCAHVDYREDRLLEEIHCLQLSHAANSNTQGGAEDITHFIDLFYSATNKEYHLVLELFSDTSGLFEVVSKQFLERGIPYTEKDASQVIRNIVTAVATLHGEDICFGQLSPDTIEMDTNGSCNIHLMDLSQASICKKGDYLTRPRGEPGFCAPEQLKVKRSEPVNFDKSADIWSLGVILYQLVCGYPPFEGDGNVAIAASATARLMFPKKQWANVSENLMDLLKQHMLNRHPSKRYSAAQLMAHPWVSGEHFAALEPGQAGTGPMTASVRRLMVNNAKRKFRACVRVAMAQNRLVSIVEGLNKERTMLKIRAVLGEKELVKLYSAFEKAASKEMVKEEKQGMEQLLELKKSTKLISKTNFCEVLVKVVPQAIPGPNRAQAHYDQFAKELVWSPNAGKYHGTNPKMINEENARKKAEHQLISELIDYREYLVSLASLTMRGKQKDFIKLVFNLYDEDGNGEVDREEYSALVSGMMMTSSLSEDELLAALNEDFDKADTDGDGSLSLKEFVAAASALPRLKAYFAELGSISSHAADDAEKHLKVKELHKAALNIQRMYRGKKARRDSDASPEPEGGGGAKIDGLSKNIVFSHPVFAEEFELSMPISEHRILGLKKLFALADIEHLGAMGPLQFRSLIKMLQMNLSPQEARRLFKDIDDDDSGSIEFVEFAEAMLEHFDEDQIAEACSVEVGAMGTAMWTRGNIIWCANSSLIVGTIGMFTVFLWFFEFVLVPVLISYFMVFLCGPLMDLFEKRPYILNGKSCCAISNKYTRIKMHGTWKAGCYDLFVSCKLPHFLSVLLTIVVVLASFAIITALAISEGTVLMKDNAFMSAWWQMQLDIDAAFNASGVEVFEGYTQRGKDYDKPEGYTMEELEAMGGSINSAISYFGLVFLFTVYIMSTRDPMVSRKNAGAVAQEIESMIEYYIVLKTALSLLTGLAVTLILLAAQVKLAVLFGILSFMLNYIPNVGSMVAMVLPLPIILLDTNLALWQRVLGVVGPGTVQGYVGNALEPVVFGKSLNMTPLSILGALVIWGSIWGIPGAILSVPLLGIQKICLDHSNHPMAKMVLLTIRDDPTVSEEMTSGSSSSNDDLANNNQVVGFVDTGPAKKLGLSLGNAGTFETS